MDQLENQSRISINEFNIKINIKSAPRINFAYQQNAVPILYELILENHEEQDFHNLTLQLNASPAFIEPRVWHIQSIYAGNQFEIIELLVQIDGEYLRQLQESQQGTLNFTLYNADDVVLAKSSQPIEVLARNEWGGLGRNPELLAAFCMPNDEAIERLLRSTSDVLRQNREDGTLHPYHSADTKRILQQVSALWIALLSTKLDYAYPPVNYQIGTQKIRTPSDIFSWQRATCLDSTLLMAAALEQMGLYPLLILEKRHAYLGVWLKEDNFSKAYNQDLATLRNRVSLNEILLVETTLLSQQVKFTESVKRAKHHLLSDEKEFEGVLDIVCARGQRVRPLSYADSIINPKTENDFTSSTRRPFGHLDLEVADDVLTHTPEINWSNPVGTILEGRIGQWQRKLLDLSLRNPLLNMRKSKTNIQLIAPNPGLLEDYLAEGKPLSIDPLPLNGIRDELLHTQQTGEFLEDEVALSALQRQKIYVNLDKKILEVALIELYRRARNDLEEGGSNTLFLAIGTLCWQRADEEKTHHAPLILIPVSMERKSIRSGIKITLSDDEPRFNTTLLEMLRQDFALDIQGLEGPLPQDESGTDIQAILTKIRQEIRDVSGFEVRDEVHLSTFSFAKYLMWKDLVDRTDKLKENPVVKHLIETPREPFQSHTDFFEPRMLDEKIPPESIFTPLSADSSQLAAIVASAAGKNFVMIGPPGTGKSQTIANMIAHNLGLGRRILFVSEKSAALNVVYRRLHEQGLGEFCLELHSNKARKLDVLKQLGDAWDARGGMDQAQWQQETHRLKMVRDELNQLEKALHERHPNGLTVRQALSIASGFRDIPEIPLSWQNSAQHNPEFHQNLIDSGARLDLIGQDIGALKNSPFKLIHTDDWGLAWQQTLLSQTQTMIDKTAVWKERLQQFQQRLNVQDASLGTNQQLALVNLGNCLLESSGQNLDFAFNANVVDIIPALTQARGLIEEFLVEERSLSCPYQRDMLLNADLWSINEIAKKASQSWWLPKQLGLRKARKLLQQRAGAGSVLQTENDLPKLFHLQTLNKQISALQPVLRDLTVWAGLDSNLIELGKSSHLAEQLRNSMSSLVQEPEALMTVRSEVRKLVVDGNELLNQNASIGGEITRFQLAYNEYQQSVGEFIQSINRDPKELTELTDNLDRLTQTAEFILQNSQKLNSWCAWRRARTEAMDLGLYPIVNGIESGQITFGQAKETVNVNYARWWVGEQIDRNATLRHFVSVEHEQKIQNFRALDEKIRSITADYIRSRIRTGLVEKEDAQKTSEFGILRRELEKKTRHKPVRQLMSEAPNAIPQLTPCLLMSPLSIAQYLPVDHQPFDLVIFDEASQITVWDAIGAIARGKQAIVVGDTKQLPPTNFFGSNQQVEDDEYEEEDLESILDEMLGASIPTINLSWHYRSRHESLITFSNHRYYRGGLITFPSPVTQDTAVSLEFVGGVYERGGSQTNRAEADAIIAEIESRLLNPETCGQTLGVVTFNQKQQDLIANLLDAARHRNSELDQFFSESLIEPVFVKNLESVQGDERDVILFSTTFGPDMAGNVSMNFGPLNKNGGERRLNVAITRARMALKVFSSLRPEQIDLSRTQATGVQDLKHFLEFAEKGARALAEAVYGSIGDFDSPLEESVSRDLSERGWTLHPQVGVSQFRIDLGVVDPDAPGRYLAGIECDGATYHRSATARDRDMVRESVLRGLGWEILRLWSTDYWIDPKGVIDKLDHALKQLHLQQQQKLR